MCFPIIEKDENGNWKEYVFKGMFSTAMGDTNTRASEALTEFFRIGLKPSAWFKKYLLPE